MSMDLTRSYKSCETCKHSIKLRPCDAIDPDKIIYCAVTEFASQTDADDYCGLWDE